MIYLDNAATTMRKPQAVTDAVVAALTNMGNASRGAHGSALHASRAVYDARVKLARLLGCKRSDHVVLTCNATEALNIAISGAIAPGGNVVTTVLEHNSVLRPLYRLEAEGKAELRFAPADRAGVLDYAALESLADQNTRAIVCTHASNLTGNAVDVARIGRMARERGILFIVDGSQSAGALPVDMESMNIDILCFTGHKGLMAPQGTGGLCIREGVEIQPFKVGGSGVQSYSKTQPEELPTRLEAGTLNGHGAAGLSAALDFIAETGLDVIEARESALMRRFYEGVRSIPGVTVYGDFSQPRRAAIVSLNIGDSDSSMISDVLAEDYEIATRPGAHCAPLMHMALGTTEQGAVRFSFSYFNTEDEIDAAIAAVRELAE